MNDKFTRLHQRIFHTWVSPPQNRNWSHPQNLSCIPNQRKYTLVCCDVVAHPADEAAGVPGGVQGPHRPVRDGLPARASNEGPSEGLQSRR